MRCNPWRWLWGLIPIAMLSWITFNWERGNIEADLGHRAQEELDRQGQGWAITEFSGRDAALRGRAAAEDEPKKAFEAVRKLWGVRVVDQRTDLMPKADVFNWVATSNKGKLTLSGHVPSEAARKSVLSVAKANFPKLAIEDAMQMARGAPPQDVWIGGANFALRQLAQLNRGTADLNGRVAFGRWRGHRCGGLQVREDGTRQSAEGYQARQQGNNSCGRLALPVVGQAGAGQVGTFRSRPRRWSSRGRLRRGAQEVRQVGDRRSYRGGWGCP